LARLIDWAPLARELDGIHSASKGEPAWPPLALSKALLIAVWHDLSDVKLAEALDNRASFRRFCGFSSNETTPERTAFVRFRNELVVRGLNKTLFDAVTCQLKAKTVTVKTGTLIDTTVIVSASHQDDEAKWAAHRTRKAVHGFKAHVGADADTALVEELSVTPGNVHDGRAAMAPCRMIQVPFTPAPRLRGESQGRIPHVVQIGVWGRAGDDALQKLKSWNYSVQRIRCRIEKIFGTWKRSYGLRRMRWRGLAKATLQVHLTAIAYNLKRTATILGTATA